MQKGNEEPGSNFSGLLNQNLLSFCAEKIEKIRDQRENLELMPEADSIVVEIQNLFTQVLGFYQESQIIFKDTYKTQVFQSLSQVLNPGNMKSLGLGLLKGLQVEKPVNGIEIISAVSQQYYEKISPIIYQSSQFQPVFSKLAKFYSKILDQRIEKELQGVPIDLDKSIIEEYRTSYLDEPLSFQEFLNLQQSHDSPLSFDENETESGEDLRVQFNNAVEKKKNDQKKQKQMESFDNYKNYFGMDERALKKAKRRSQGGRKRSKKTRRGKFQK